METPPGRKRPAPSPKSSADKSSPPALKLAAKSQLVAENDEEEDAEQMETPKSNSGLSEAHATFLNSIPVS